MTSRFFGIILLNLTAALGLAGLLLQPGFVKEAGAELFTPGAGKTGWSLNRRVYSMGTEVAGGLRIYDLRELDWEFADAGSLVVRGYGLPAAAWRGRTWPMDFRPSAQPAGFVDIQWPFESAPGHAATLRGRCRGEPVDSVRLLAPDQAIAGEATPDVDQRFSMSVRGKFPGQFLYRLQALRDGEIVFDEPLPLLVRPPRTPRTWILQSRPSFQSNAVKHWLIESGAALSSFVRLSREVERAEHHGMEASDSRLTADVLADLNLLILDAERLLELPPDQGATLSSAVMNGLGVLVVDPGPLLAGDVNSLLKESGFNLNRLTGETLGWSLAPGENTDSDKLLFDSNGAPLLWRRNFGAGSVGIAFAEDTDTMITSGRANDFGDLWGSMAADVARVAETDQRLSESAVWVGERVAFSDEMNGDAEVWPVQAGWIQFGADEEEGGLAREDTVASFWRYAFRPNHDWVAWRAQQTIAATRNAELRGQAARMAPSAFSLSPWMCWFLFLASATMLWWERKRSAWNMKT